ncbi:MAG: hypothetical protein C3F13_04805 [Anaerolineales bacterium]|nr:hypothetical protein [Anaerolineae bacterium]PWB55043.1 MAG: hypothetical protein C3F13_04805 [Anaerolineales bacterium]
MELHLNLDLAYDVDAVLRGQGADPAVLRARRPALVEIAERARQESLSLLAPRVVYREYTVAGVQHERLLLGESKRLESSLLARQLAPATKVIILLATIGDELEECVSKIWEADMVYALALDGAGSGAVEALANAACRYFEKKALEEGLQASIPFSPGMVNWSVAEGQPQIFELLGEDGSIVSLTPSFVMIPRKSLTMVMGLGTNLDSSGRTCDFCTMRATCRYQDHYLYQT